MDKETLSNYGWIVICILVLSVMIALATPFGRYIETAVKSTTQGMFDVQQKAMDSAGLEMMQQEFNTMLNGDINSDPSISEHGFYYNQPYSLHDNENNSTLIWIFRDIGMITVYLVDDDDCLAIDPLAYELKDDGIYIEGTNSNIVVSTDHNSILVPDFLEGLGLDDVTLSLIDEVACDDDYIYVYSNTHGGYMVVTTDDTKDLYKNIKSSINNKPTVFMLGTFSNCENLIAAPNIPNSVTTIGDYTFWYCKNMASVTIPESVTSIGYGAFNTCTSLNSISIPKGVSFIGNGAFADCTSLVSIRFAGTVNEWNAILFEAGWHRNVPATKVICSDGEVTL